MDEQLCGVLGPALCSVCLARGACQLAASKQNENQCLDRTEGHELPALVLRRTAELRNPLKYTVDTSQRTHCASIRNTKVKQSYYSPGQGVRVPGGSGSQISRQSAHEDGKFVSPTHRPPLPPRKYSCYSFLLGAESRLPVHSTAGRITSMKNFNDTTGNRTRDLPDCSAVPQSNSPPRTPKHKYYCWIMRIFLFVLTRRITDTPCVRHARLLL